MASSHQPRHPEPASIAPAPIIPSTTPSIVPSIVSSIVSSLSYHALLRDLPRVERADVDSATLGRVAARLTDPAEVAASRVLPYRLWLAARHSGTVLFGPELEQALQLSLANVPPLPGRSLVLVDTSGSMLAPISGHAGVRACEIAAVFAAAVADAARCSGGQADVVLYATGSARYDVHPSVPRAVEDIAARIGAAGHGTDTWTNAARWFAGHDRVLVLTDTHDHPADAGADVDRWPCPVAVWDLRGKGRAHADARCGRSLFAGYSDAHLRVLPRLDAGRAAVRRREQPVAGAA